MALPIEIILVVIVAPILEALLTAIFGVIEARWRWHPLKNKFDTTIAEATDKSFVMMADADTKAVQIFALVCAIIGYILGILLSILLFVKKKAESTDAILIALTFQVVMLPMLLCALHYTTKKIYFSEKHIVVKSLIYFKKITVDSIVEVTETDYTPAIKMLLIECNNKKSIKIKQNFGNYELAKKRFVDMKLLK